MTYSHKSTYKAHQDLIDASLLPGSVELPGFRNPKLPSQAVIEARYRYGLTMIPSAK